MSKQEKKILILEAKLSAWKRYAKDLELWHYRKYASDMERHMMKPNAPDAEYTNNH